MLALRAYHISHQEKYPGAGMHIIGDKAQNSQAMKFLCIGVGGSHPGCISWAVAHVVPE